MVDQRGFSSAVTQTGEAYTIDRWKTRMTSNSKFSVQKVADAPAGFYNSAKITSLAATTASCAFFTALYAFFSLACAALYFLKLSIVKNLCSYKPTVD